MTAVLQAGVPWVVTNAEGSRTAPSGVESAKVGEWFAGDLAKLQAVLRKLKRDAEAYLGEKITDAVIAVPAILGDAGRQATKEAAEIAGLTVLQIINEPVAAAMAYRLDRGKAANILFFELGRRALHTSLLIASDGVTEVRAASEDNHLGGDDWSQRIVDWLVKDFRNGYGIDLSEDRMALHRLREAAEKAKIELSQWMESRINLPYISHSEDGPLHLEARLTRAGFQRMTSDLLDRCKSPFRKVIEDSRVEATDIDHVVLAGGSTRMPAVVNLVKSLAGGKEPWNDINPVEVFAFGACLHAGLLKGKVNGSQLPGETPPANEHAIAQPTTAVSAAGTQTRDKVFISYSHADAHYMTEFSKFLRLYMNNELMAVWDDTRIRPGEPWEESIEHALASAKLAVLVVSVDFFDSEFIRKRELPPLLEAARSGSVTILWIPLRTSPVELTAIWEYQPMHPPERPIVSLPGRHARERAWKKICEDIRDAYRR